MEVLVMSLARACLCPFRTQMTDFYNLLSERLSSLFMLLGWSSISVPSLMIQSMHLEFFGQKTGILQSRI